MISFPDANGLVVIIQVTNRCQLSCSYCEVIKDNKEMTIKTLEKTIENLSRIIPKNRSLTFIWHGGEPLLMGVDFFYFADKIQSDFFDQQKIRNVIQTNGLLLSEKFISFLSEKKSFRLNISMDGPSITNVKARGVNSESYDRLFIELKKNNVKFGTVVVASPIVRDHRNEVCEYFRSRGINNVGLVPFHTKDNPSKYDLSPTLISDIIFTPLKYDKRTITGINLLGRNLITRIINQNFGKGCFLSSFESGCHQRVVSIDPDGDVFTCPRGRNANLWKYGNIDDKGLQIWWESTKSKSLFRTNLPKECVSCKWVSLCNGGCPANAHTMNGGAINKDYYCESFKEIFFVIDKIIEEEYVASINIDKNRKTSNLY